jgi:hypothetical protein
MIIHVQIKEIWKIFQDLGNRPIVFIRFNSEVMGCFKRNKSG